MTKQLTVEELIDFLNNQRAHIDEHLIDAAIAPLQNSLSLENGSLQGQEKRKQVTILFADVSGFTAMSEKMDAEDVHDFIQVLWNKLDKIVVDHGGKIDKHIGDAIMALWGVNSTREDDPERAVRAAVAMQSEIQQWQQELSESNLFYSNQSLSVRIGINTGPVILGRVGTVGEYTAMGDTVNTASRLEKLAPLGNILISRNTYLHVRGLFDLRERAPLQAKGKSRPLETYLVQRERPRSFRLEQRGIKGVATPMVGRDDEFNWLQQHYYKMLLENQQSLVILSGDAGLGKTRLIYEIDSWIESLSWKTSGFKARARQSSEGQPYYLITELIRSYFNILYSDHIEVAREKITVKIEQDISSIEQCSRFRKVCLHAVGIDEIDLTNSGNNFEENSATTPSSKFNNPRENNITAQLLPGIREFIEAISTIEPTVIMLEDIHWADSASLQFIYQLHTETSDHLLMILATARPDFFRRHPQWMQKETEAFGHLRLEPLSEDSGRELIGHILQRVEQIPEKLFSTIIQRSEGNPYHIEEFIKLLIADNVIILGKTNWSIRTNKLMNVRVPTTLINILQARIDQLPSDVRQVIRCASIMGYQFWDDAITYMLQDQQNDVQKMVNGVLSYLLENKLISEIEVDSTTEGREFVFNNTLLHQVVYEGILKRKRRVLHKAVGRWLAEQVESELLKESVEDVSAQKLIQNEPNIVEKV